MCSNNFRASWDAAVVEYLSNRRALGRRYKSQELVLKSVGSFLEEHRVHDLNDHLFHKWVKPTYSLSNARRVQCESTVYKFCLYRRRSEPNCFLPNTASFAKQRPGPLPRLIDGQQIAQMLGYIEDMPRKRWEPLRPAVLRLAVILLYTTGMRRGELLRLTLADVDAQQGLLFIRESKFHKSRWVPVSATVRTELRKYLALRTGVGMNNGDAAPLFCSVRGREFTGTGFANSIKKLMRAAGVRDRDGRQPRIRDFRHSFAVAALLRWYENDENVQVNLPKLALYMGHVSIVSTAYYLRLMPAVIAQASTRFERSFAHVLDGGES